MGGGTRPALVNSYYSEELQCWGGDPPYAWSYSGSLPPGLDLDANTGEIHGTPTEVREWTFTVRVTDAAGAYVERKFTIRVVELTVKGGPVNTPEALIPALSKDTVMMQMRLRTAPSITAVDITGFTFTAYGTGNDSTDVENIRLFTDDNNNGRLDSTDTQLGESQTYSADDGTVTFDLSSSPLSLGPSEYVYLILVYDFTKNAWPDEQFQVFVSSGSDVAASCTLAGPPVRGGMQKIRNPNWVLRNPTIRDSGANTVPLLGRTNHDWAYDSERKVFVMFSGGGATTQNETWEYDGASQVWLRVGTDPDISDPPPCPRQNHAMCYIPGHVFMFGGEVTWIAPGYILDDSNRFVSGEWGGIMGYTSAHLGVSNPYPSHWDYWHSDPCPGRRECHAMEYDEAAGVAVLYGGISWISSPPEYADTWTTTGDPGMPTDYNSTVFTEYGAIWQRQSETSAPGARYHHAMVYDSTNERIIMFGGFRASGNPGLLNDTWELTGGSTWNQFSPSHSPSARGNHDLMYDPARDVVVLFGGSDGSGTIFDDTWEFAQTEKEGTNYDWIQMNPDNFPSARDGHVMGWDPERDMPRSTYDSLYKIPDHVGRVEKGVGVLFGGNYTNETWEYLR
jgi:hypothetical protein